MPGSEDIKWVDLHLCWVTEVMNKGPCQVNMTRLSSSGLFQAHSSCHQTHISNQWCIPMEWFLFFLNGSRLVFLSCCGCLLGETSARMGFHLAVPFVCQWILEPKWSVMYLSLLSVTRRRVNPPTSFQQRSFPLQMALASALLIHITCTSCAPCIWLSLLLKSVTFLSWAWLLPLWGLRTHVIIVQRQSQAGHTSRKCTLFHKA